jgi:putative spermidine/putrescine transport system ATP-binding protein
VTTIRHSRNQLLARASASIAKAPDIVEPTVRIEHVTKRFQDATAVEDVSFNVERGKFLTILGPSGSGKSTLLRMIAGFMQPTSGEIYLNGKAVAAVPPYKRSIGMVFQRLALFPHMTAFQNVAYPLKMRRFAPNEISERVQKYLDLVRLTGLGQRRIHELSGGQQQRVAIARALVFQPDLLLLDEPLASLDKKLREDMQLEFRRIQQELNVTTINVTHDQREALVISDEIIVIDNARLQQKASPIDTYRNPANQFVVGFIGVTNFFTAKLTSTADGWGEVSIGKCDFTGRCGFSGEPGDLVDCAIRAEQVRIASDQSALDATIAAVIETTLFEGDRLIYTVRSPDLLEARLRIIDHDPTARRVFGRGDLIRIGWNRGDLMIFAKSV